MKLKFYPKDDKEGYTADEIRHGHHWIYADVECPHCGKLQPIAATQFIGGPCVRCGERTDGSTR